MHMLPRRRRVLTLGLVTLLIGAISAEIPIVDAAKNRDLEALRALIEGGADVDERAGDGATALLWASYRDDLEAADLLIAAGADVNIPNDVGATPIWAASRNGSPAMARKLLDAGADPDKPLLLGEAPLVTAARSGDPDVVRMLLEAGAEVDTRGPRGQTPLMLAASERHPDAVKVLLDHGANVDLRSHVWSQLMGQQPHAHPEHQQMVLHGGNTALMFAARVGDVQSVRHLLAAGADIDGKSAWGMTPLVMAVYADFGDQWVIREQTGDALIYFDRDAILPGEFPELIELLLMEGADPNAGAERYSALIMAVLRQNERAVELLLAHGADPDFPLGDFTPHQRGSTTDYYLQRAWVGASPLWLAARFSTPGIVRRLIEAGADPHFVHHAVYWGGRPGGILSQRIDEVTTTLHAALKVGAGRPWTVIEPTEQEVLETVKLLVEAGVDVNAEDHNGRTALRTAMGSVVRERGEPEGYPSVAEYLIQNGATEPR